MKRWCSGWCETGFCSRCPELLQTANSRRREIHCECPCHRKGETMDITKAGKELAERTRKTQGLPPLIEDPSAVAEIAAICAKALKRTARRTPEEQVPQIFFDPDVLEEVAELILKVERRQGE